MKNTHQLIDTAKITIRAGNGGNGRVSFRREKFIPKGGPDGGDGGKGGSVILVADNNMATLLDFRAKPIFAAQPGEEGGKKKMSGGNGSDLIVKLPVGTLVYEVREKDDILVADMDIPGKQFLIGRGGRGGKGNFRFRSSVNQAPTQYTKGEEGEVKLLRLEVKLVADVGLVGFPNAGKSTLLNVLARTNAKVSNYPFTTLTPNLGTVRLKSGKEIVFADIPGLIEGASKGKGLGDDFLKHIERTRMLVHLIDPLDFSYTDEESDPINNSLKKYDIIRQELADYGAHLSDKKEIVVITKMDLTEVRETFTSVQQAFKKKGIEVLGISGVTSDGVETFMNKVQQTLEKSREKVAFNVETPVKVFNINNLPNRRMVFKHEVYTFEGDKKVG